MSLTKFDQFTLTGSVNNSSDFIVGYRDTGSSKHEVRFPVSLFGTSSISTLIGDLNTLTTTAKDTIVSSINEVNSNKITLSSLSAIAPLVYTSGVFSIPAASSITNGYLTSTDWNTFNNKPNGITLTTVGTNGLATYNAGTLNIPSYVGMAGNETISDTKTFISNIVAPGIGTTSNIDFKITRNSIMSGFLGTSNTTYGVSSLANILNNTGGSLSSFGINSLSSNTTGSYNTALGANTLYSNTTGYSNTSIGSSSLYLNTTGYNNVSVGDSSLYYNIVGNYNTSIGNQALHYNTGSQNTALGYNTLGTLSSGSYNTGIGSGALYGDIDGTYNTAIGYRSMFYANHPTNNIAIGYFSLAGSEVVGVNAIPDHNIAIGEQVLRRSTGSTYSIGIGYCAGSYYGAVAYSGSNDNTSPNNSIYIGNQAEAGIISPTNEIVIGNSVVGKGTNTTSIGNSNTTSTHIYGTLNLPSNTTTGVLLIDTNKLVSPLAYDLVSSNKFLKSNGTWGEVAISNLAIFNTLDSGNVTYTLVLTDSGKTIETTSTTSTTITIPLNSAVAFPIGTEINILRYSSGTVTFTPTNGVTINSRNSLLTIGHQYAGVTLIKRATDEWYLVGDLA